MSLRTGPTTLNNIKKAVNGQFFVVDRFACLYIYVAFFHGTLFVAALSINPFILLPAFSMVIVPILHEQPVAYFFFLFAKLYSTLI